MENTDKGFLIVSVTSARGSFPISGANVRIYSTENDGTQLLYTLVTDESGKTVKVALDAPPFSASQSPDSGIVPYARYIIDTDYSGYYSVQNINAPIYSGITSIQNVSLIPITENRRVNAPTEDTRFNESVTPQL